MYLYVIIGIVAVVWLYVVWVAFFAKKKNKDQKIEKKEYTSIPSEFLKERTITLEDGSFGMRIEFLKQDLSFEELASLGQNVFSLKTFIEESRAKKENMNQIDTVDFSNPPKFEMKFDEEDIPSEIMESLHEQEAFKLPESESFINLENLK